MLIESIIYEVGWKMFVNFNILLSLYEYFAKQSDVFSLAELPLMSYTCKIT